MKKKEILLAVTAGIVLLGMVFADRSMGNYSLILKANWGVSLPMKACCSEVYRADSSGSPHGDGLRYHVYSYRYEDEIERMFAWTAAEQETVFHHSYSEAAADWLDELSVPEEYIPVFSECAYWYHTQEDHSEIVIFWDSEKNLLSIVESFL